ncbi:hypothetical protein [Azotobacter beijerinckii]|uniref:hypothetical protein n=1 Tax=Azotobacter beijerinckii TaxID=170623 RepID=UPI002954B192|nr:hypothetical protein [Azotobacter beijerinckii]MDV7213087.1 hypothetical protein [Azotobacter beijerinckii]
MKRKITTLRLLNVFLTVLFSLSLTAVFTITPAAFGFGWPYSSNIGSILAVFSWTVGLGAWVILVAMGIAWAYEKRLHKAIPITGTIIGSLSILPWIPTIIPMLTLSPALVLAVRLVRYHLNQKQSDTGCVSG